MQSIDIYLTDHAPLAVSEKSKGEIKTFIQNMLNICKIDLENNLLNNIQINILDFNDWFFYISANKIEILDIQTGKFLDLEKLNEDFNLDFKTIYRGESHGSFEDYYLDYDEFVDDCGDEDIKDVEEKILSKIESIDQDALEANALVLYKKV